MIFNESMIHPFMSRFRMLSLCMRGKIFILLFSLCPFLISHFSTTSLKMNVDMRTISLNYSHRIAYQIGTTIYTYFDLTNTCLVRTDQITLTL